MIKNYEWRDLRNAVGCAAVCARLALKFYRGNWFADVVAAIEIAERYAAGEEIDDVSSCSARASRAADSAGASSTARAARAASHAANAARSVSHGTSPINAAANAGYYASKAFHAAVLAGVSQEAVDQAQLPAIAVDLGLVFESETYFAAIAALAIGDIAWAREIAESSECP